jgi:subtilase family serine protease
VPASNARGWTETAWNGAGSGCSAYEPKPAFQTDTGCARRTVADVSAIADPNTGVAVYDTYHVSGWLVFGGTSVAAPVVAAIYALAGNGSTISSASHVYANPVLNDVVSGSNGACGGSYLCTAGPGYDGPTGLGTPAGTVGF